jgi:hypothetical protein
VRKAKAAMTRGAHRLVAWQRLLLYVAGVLLLVSGAGWLVLHLARASDALPSPFEAWSMRIHGLAAFAVIFVFGALAAAHIPQGWRISHRWRWERQRGSGVALCVLAATVALTGYLLYYFAPEAVRPALGWLHSGLGTAMAVIVAAHRRGAGGRPHRPHGVANERESHSHVHRGRPAVPPRP